MMGENLSKVLEIFQSIDEESENEWGGFIKQYPNIFKLLNLLFACALKHDEEIERLDKVRKTHEWKLNTLKEFVLNNMDVDDPFSASMPNVENSKLEIN